MARPPRPLAERFWKHVERGPTCWLWTASTRNTYGTISSEGGRDAATQLYAHRVSYALAYGEPPADAVLHHICENHLCVNPAHLRPVTRGDHKRHHPEVHGVPQSHCKRGHAFTPDNLYWRTNGDGVYHRTCKACAKARDKRQRLARQAKAA